MNVEFSYHSHGKGDLFFRQDTVKSYLGQWFSKWVVPPWPAGKWVKVSLGQRQNKQGQAVTEDELKV